MIKWVTFILQILALRKSFTESASAIDYAKSTMEKARGYFLYSLGCIVASLFFLISVTVAVIGVGLQLEQRGNLSFSGLMVSAVIFFGISVFFFVVSFLALLIEKQKLLEKQTFKDQKTGSSSQVSPLLEEILKQILINLTKPSAESHNESSKENVKPV